MSASGITMIVALIMAIIVMLFLLGVIKIGTNPLPGLVIGGMLLRGRR